MHNVWRTETIGSTNRGANNEIEQRFTNLPTTSPYIYHIREYGSYRWLPGTYESGVPHQFARARCLWSLCGRVSSVYEHELPLKFARASFELLVSFNSLGQFQICRAWWTKISLNLLTDCMGSGLLTKRKRRLCVTLLRYSMTDLRTGILAFGKNDDVQGCILKMATMYYSIGCTFSKKEIFVETFEESEERRIWPTALSPRWHSSAHQGCLHNLRRRHSICR